MFSQLVVCIRMSYRTLGAWCTAQHAVNPMVIPPSNSLSDNICHLSNASQSKVLENKELLEAKYHETAHVLLEEPVSKWPVQLLLQVTSVK